MAVVIILIICFAIKYIFDSDGFKEEIDLFLSMVVMLISIVAICSILFLLGSVPLVGPFLIIIIVFIYFIAKH